MVVLEVSARLQEATSDAASNATPEATGIGVLDIAMLIIASLALVAGVVAACSAIRSSRLTREALSKQDEQLELARSAASMIPELELVDVRYLKTSGFPIVTETLDEAERYRQEKPRGGMSRLDHLDISGFDPFTEYE